jgi:ATP-dependent RNA helicase SUPV3L1/SUV3
MPVACAMGFGLLGITRFFIMQLSADLQSLDTLTLGAFSAPTTGERAARLREWLATNPDESVMADVHRDMNTRDKSAAKVIKEKLDEVKRAKAQDAMAHDWAASAEAVLQAQPYDVQKAESWLRDAAKAGAALSREPLLSLRNSLQERSKQVEELQHRLQVEREAALLLAQRIELCSTKPWRQAAELSAGLQHDVHAWLGQMASLSAEPMWSSVPVRITQQITSSGQQLELVWQAFEAALQSVEVAANDPAAELPAVPVWADEIRVLRGESPASAGASTQAAGAVTATPTEAATSRTAPLPASPEADAARQVLVDKAQALNAAEPEQQPAGRKLQEAIRQLREQWKTLDKAHAPNPTLWKPFDQACNTAYKRVETWLQQVRQQSEATRQQRLTLIQELNAWTEAQASSEDWKAQVRELHGFSERWRQAGHLSEKAFADIQPLWKTAMAKAHERLEAAQKQSLVRRQTLIADAQALVEQAGVRIDDVKALQQRWQAEAQAVPLDRRQEQKLWEAFRQPIDAFFARKPADRRAAPAVAPQSPYEQAVMVAAQALEVANQTGDAQKIRAALAALEAAARGEAPAPAAPAVVAEVVVTPEAASEDSAPVAQGTAEASESPEVVEPTSPAPEPVEEAAGELSEAEAPAPEEVPPAKPAPAAPRKVVAVRGDDRPGAGPAGAKPLAARDDARRDGRKDLRPGRGDSRDARPPREGFAPRPPRLSDGVFRLQRQAMEQAEIALKKLAAQAYGEALTQLLQAWQTRAPDAIPQGSALGGKAAVQARSQWAQTLGQAAQGTVAADLLVRLEIAADVPTPAAHQGERRAMQLQLLTRRNDPSPEQTWAKDINQVLQGTYDEAVARRLQSVLKTLLRR